MSGGCEGCAASALGAGAVSPAGFCCAAAPPFVAAAGGLPGAPLGCDWANAADPTAAAIRVVVSREAKARTGSPVDPDAIRTCMIESFDPFEALLLLELMWLGNASAFRSPRRPRRVERAPLLQRLCRHQIRQERDAYGAPIPRLPWAIKQWAAKTARE